MEHLPSTIYVAIGTIIAALVSAIISIVNAVLSKELKLSELRQNWIDELRIELSSLVSLINKLSISWSLVEEKNNKNLNSFIKSHLEDIQKIDTIIHKLQMRLNPEEHKVLIGYLNEMDECCSDEKKLEDDDALHDLFSKYTKESNRVLKVEWVRVKTGEGSYKKMIGIFKFVAYASGVSLALIAIIA